MKIDRKKKETIFDFGGELKITFTAKKETGMVHMSIHNGCRLSCVPIDSKFATHLSNSILRWAKQAELYQSAGGVNAAPSGVQSGVETE